MPDRTAGEAVHHPHAEPGSRTRGVFHLAGRTLADPLRVAVAPHSRREDGLVARVDSVAHRLADEVVADRVDGEAVPGEQLMSAPAVGRIGERGPNVEVVPPAGEFEAVVAPGGSLLRQGPPAADRPTGR